MKNTCEFPAFTAYLLENYMVHIEFKKVKKLSAQDVQEVFNCHKKIGQGKKVFVLVTFSGFIPMSDEAMEQAKKNAAAELQAATAYVVNNVALRMSIKFFMNFYKPKHPITISGSKAEALVWLKQEKRKVEVKESVLA